MKRVVVLDSGPAGMLTNPRASDLNLRCSDWFERIIDAGAEVVLPEIVDYELRRELIRAEKTRGLQRLDELGEAVTYLPLNTAMMQEAARLWAAVRARGLPTAPPGSIDVDVILAAQTLSLSHAETDLLLATTNVGHLAQFVMARKRTLLHERRLLQRARRLNVGYNVGKRRPAWVREGMTSWRHRSHSPSTCRRAGPAGLRLPRQSRWRFPRLCP